MATQAEKQGARANENQREERETKQLANKERDWGGRDGMVWWRETQLLTFTVALTSSSLVIISGPEMS